MDKETNIFPKIDLFPRITKLVHFLFDHHQTNTGAAVMLDNMLDEPQVIDLREVVPEETQLMLDYWTVEE